MSKSVLSSNVLLCLSYDRNYDKKRIICIVDISRGGPHPTTIHIKNQSNCIVWIMILYIAIVMISPLNHPSIISFSTQQHSKPSSDSCTIEVFKNHTTIKRKLIPLNGLHEGQRCCISGVLVKISPMSKKSEDQLYQVFLIDETTSVPIRISVYLQSNDTNPYFQVFFCHSNNTQYYGTCVILSNISMSSYKGVLNGKFLSKYSGIITYHPQTKEVVIISLYNTSLSLMMWLLNNQHFLVFIDWVNSLPLHNSNSFCIQVIHIVWMML